MFPFFDVRGRWGKRPEDAAALAQRLGRFIGSLASIHPRFQSWEREGMRSRSTVPRLITQPSDTKELQTWLEENRAFGVHDGHKAHIGYNVRAGIRGIENEFASFDLSCAAGTADYPYGNRIDTTIECAGVARSVRFGLARSVLLTLAEVWQADWAGVSSGDFRAAQCDQHDPAASYLRYHSGWMVYIDANLSGGLKEPEDIAIERLANGAMILTATKEAFDRESPVHNAAARRIQAALEPINRISGA